MISILKHFLVHGVVMSIQNQRINWITIPDLEKHLKGETSVQQNHSNRNDGSLSIQKKEENLLVSIAYLGKLFFFIHSGDCTLLLFVFFDTACTTNEPIVNIPFPTLVIPSHAVFKTARWIAAFGLDNTS
jgi:hypothetical protein